MSDMNDPTLVRRPPKIDFGGDKVLCFRVQELCIFKGDARVHKIRALREILMSIFLSISSVVQRR
jgi:hypothetical protein